MKRKKKGEKKEKNKGNWFMEISDYVYGILRNKN